MGWEPCCVRNWYGVREGEYEMVTVIKERRAECYNVADDPRERRIVTPPVRMS